MSRVYYSSHKAKRLAVNFNQKIWRQDLAYFIKQKLSWHSDTEATTAKNVDKNKKIFDKGYRYFHVRNLHGDVVYVEFKQNNVITQTSCPKLLEEYLVIRGVKVDE